MSKAIVETYIFTCDYCDKEEVEETDDLPFGWEDIDGLDMCDDCFLEYNMLEEDERELCFENLA